ncbi:glycosyltransferase family 2 protein [Puniceicoccus vermicola]|uniref:Glycosyltransferase n=1 Tax=Puniceicoccus vermicola TaxID=388746 RepID=A0A7X1E4Z7_9BACT|nr:glycosyltransferase [Puniceicoccus vermicola]MBC2601102.1 glycosyltransferase [Puniceicoccus vermicola]
MTPRISILLPVYNGEKYLRAAIESIVAQSYPHWELLVLDDGSTDGSLEIARSFTDERVRALPNDENLGVAKTLNRAIDKARGELIARMDADDGALPERLAKQVEFLEKNPNVDLLGTNAISAETGESTFAVPTEHEDIRCNLLFNCSFLHPTVMWRAEAFREKGLVYEETPTAEDYDLWERACSQIRSANLSEPLLRYRNDPEVKVTAYVRQQKEGGRRIRERALRRLGMKPSREEMEVHHAVSYDNLPQPAVELSRVDEWMGEILRANRSSGVLDESALRTRLHLQRYYHLGRNRPATTVRRLLWAGNGLARVPTGLAIRSLTKLVCCRSNPSREG